jgi:iron complex outermembrane recepter protein
MPRSIRFLAATTILSSLLPHTALAQAAPGAPSAAAESEELGEIIVTARKKAESIQDVPLTVNALSAEAMEVRQVRTVEDLLKYTPGMNFVPGNSRFNSSISVRGMNQVSAVGDNRRDIVTTFIDGVPYVGNPSGIGTQGIERAEVIKGPQSALFGRATFGGAISLVV